MNINNSTLKAYLNSELSEQENDEVQLYLIEHLDDPDIQEFLDNWFDDCRTAADMLAADALEVTRSRLGMGRSRAHKVTRWAVGVVAMLIVALTSMRIGFKLHHDPEPVVWNEMQVPDAETRELTLPDGTHLILDAGSRITWPSEFRGEERTVFLEGQVTADVAPDPQHPFVIHSGEVDVQVYGTTFNFKSYRSDNIVELMLLDGRVSMNIPSEEGEREICLTPGDIAQYDINAGEISVAKLSPENFQLLSSGCKSFCFINLPLCDIASELERSFGVKIFITDPELVSRRFLAIFPNGEGIDEILRLLAVNDNFKITREKGIIYIN